MNLILTSYMNLYEKDEEGTRIAQNFGNANQILDLIKKLTPKQENFLLVASDAENYELTDMYSNPTIESFEMTFPFKNYTILDNRTKQNAKELVKNADLIYLAGGHVPTQHKFFEEINLKKLLKGSKALIIGASAGSLNSATIVYSQPELEGETLDPNYKKYIRGLGLTNVSIIPHFEERFDWMLDEKNILCEISLPDSKIRPFIAYSDGAHIYDNGKKQLMYGKAYLFENGTFVKISEDETVTDITKLVKQKFDNKKYQKLLNG